MALRIRVQILPKIAAIVGLIGIIIVGCIWHATGQLAVIGTRYAHFVAHDAKADQIARNIIGLIYQTNYTIYRTIAETDASQIQRASAEVDAAMSGLRASFAALAAESPDLGPKIEAVRSEVDRFIGDVAEARSLGVANKNSEALAIVHRKVDPRFPALVRDATALSDSVTARMEGGAQEVAGQIDATGRDLWLFTGFGLLAGFAAATFVGVLGISRPLSRLVAVLRQLAAGATVERITEARRGDEIGAVARAVDDIRVLVARNAAERAERQRSADSDAAAERRRAVTALADAFEAAIGGIVGTVSASASDLQATASVMSGTANATARQSATVASAAEETAQTVNAAAAAAEQLGASVTEIGRQAGDSASLAQAAVTEADRTAEHVSALSTAVTEISDVVSLIARIAEQTNLLALNATIEAARAGEAGRGFSVVASEVKELASQTGRATETISQRISLIQTSTGQAVGSIDAIAGRIRQINGVAAAMASAISQQGTASREIVHNVTMAATGTDHVTRTIVDVAGAAEQTGTAAGQVLGAADALSRQSEQLRGEVAHFLATVRAA